jgi:hypothetical protein
MGFSDFLENSLLNYAFGGIQFIPSGTLYVGLSSGNPGDTGSGEHEPVGNGYARVAVINTKANWSTSTTGVLVNISTVTFPISTAPWGYINYVTLRDAPTNGNLLAYGSGSNPQNIYTGNMPIFPSGSIVLTLD